MRKGALFLSLFLLLLPAAAHAKPASSPSLSVGAPAPVPTELPFAPTGPNDKLQYYGGHVLSNVEVVAVFWTSAVNAQIQSDIGTFYTTITKSPWIDWLTEYDTIGLNGYADNKPGTNQHIGRGTFLKSVVITPANMSTTLTDMDIQTELVAQIQANKLPQPSMDASGGTKTLYMIDFPPGITITLLNIQSCSSFGAYHFTATMNGKSIPYGVHPDCGYSWNSTTLVHSHELMEAITDTEVGLVDQNGPNVRPLGWVTVAATTWANQEIADICEGGPGDTVAGYTVARGWSNYAMACVAQIPICTFATKPTACRPCNPFDSGQACSGTTPACATKGPRTGLCVPCTSAYASACSGATPVCDDELNTCVQCVTNADCKDPNQPVCEQATNTCRGCRSDAECPAGDKCDLSFDAGGGGRCEKPAPPPGSDAGPVGPDAGGDDGGALNDQGAGNSGGCGCVVLGARGEGEGALAAIAAAYAACAVARRRRAR
jgi:hypothetical protein